MKNSVMKKINLMQMKIASNEVIHFVGIGGIGMSGLAQIMHNMNFVIQGSDLTQSKNINQLRKLFQSFLLQFYFH